LSERQWGTVREDYSGGGDAWDYFPHAQARWRAYRWGEDEIAGICDERQRLCLSLALWNGAERFRSGRVHREARPRMHRHERDTTPEERPRPRSQECAGPPSAEGAADPPFWPMTRRLPGRSVTRQRRRRHSAIPRAVDLRQEALVTFATGYPFADTDTVEKTQIAPRESSTMRGC